MDEMASGKESNGYDLRKGKERTQKDKAKKKGMAREDDESAFPETEGRISESSTESDSSDDKTNTWNGINPTEQSGDSSNAMANMMAEFLKMQREHKKEMKRMKKELDRARRGDEWSEREKVPKYTKMSEWEDVVAFLETFESHMESYKVPVDDWTRRLNPLLIETARKVYTRLTAEERKDYAGVRKATLQYYHVTRDR